MVGWFSSVALVKVLTCIYSVRLSATFFASDERHPPAKTADAIIPISNLSPNMANYVSVPPDFSVNISSSPYVPIELMPLCCRQLNQTFPINTVQAYAELYASGNGNEEFWVHTTQYINYLCLVDVII